MPVCGLFIKTTWMKVIINIIISYGNDLLIWAMSSGKSILQYTAEKV